MRTKTEAHGNGDIGDIVFVGNPVTADGTYADGSSWSISSGFISQVDMRSLHVTMTIGLKKELARRRLVRYGKKRP